LKGLTLIAENKQSNELIPISNVAMFLPNFFDLLKKAQSQLHLNTLECLVAFTKRYGDQLISQVGSIQEEVSTMIKEEDFQRSVVALQVSSNLITIKKADASHQICIDQAINLAKTESADRQVQEALSNLFTTASKAGIVSQAQVTSLNESINLRSRVGAVCLAVTIKNQYS